MSCNEKSTLESRSLSAVKNAVLGAVEENPVKLILWKKIDRIELWTKKARGQKSIRE